MGPIFPGAPLAAAGQNPWPPLMAGRMAGGHTLVLT
jgi:hypothetical protein